MLVLTRRQGESILIGRDIEVTFLGHNYQGGNQIRLGIQAPFDVKVHRKEVVKRILAGKGRHEHGQSKEAWKEYDEK